MEMMQERYQVMEIEYEEKFSARDRVYASVSVLHGTYCLPCVSFTLDNVLVVQIVVEIQRQFALLKAPIKLTEQGLIWAWESVCIAGVHKGRNTLRAWKKGFDTWDQARLRRK